MPISAIETMHSWCDGCGSWLSSPPLCPTCSAIDRLRAILIINLSKSESEQLDGADTSENSSLDPVAISA